MPFSQPLDIANRACQHLGVDQITPADFAGNPFATKQGRNFSACYDKLRRAELRRSGWVFATRRVVMRPVVAGSTFNFTPTAWASGTTYGLGSLVTDTNGIWWVSLAASNTGNTPTDGAYWELWKGQQVAQTWSASAVYLPGDIVDLSGTLYLAIAGSTNQTPPNATYWQALVTSTPAAVVLLSPSAYTPLNFTTPRTIFRLPYNYMRFAPQDPKVAGTPRQNIGAGTRMNDYEIEHGYLFSAAQTTPFIMRFIADATYVPSMDDMFCEGLAARMAMECCEVITQKDALQKTISQAYADLITQARAINAIEAGSTEDPLISNDQGAPMPQGQQAA